MKESIQSALMVLGFVLFGLLVAAISSGCASERYVQGVDVTVGLGIPGTDYNLSLMEYISGVKVCAPSNTPYSVTYQAAMTNDYFGVIHIREHYRTAVGVRTP